MNPTSVSSGPLFLADNLALDFINTEYGVGEQHHDCLTDDQSVMNWLKMAGQLPEHAAPKVPHGLLAEARRLRDCSRALVNAAMKGVAVDLSWINQLLEAGRPVTRLEWDGKAQAMRVGVHQRDCSPASLLWPVADALVKLVTSEKFEFVRQCEAHDCILMFHDLSKSHRRRWCSMSTCGNRMKVAAFRSRHKLE
ncbi:CGNR zinc finger domain-containing protein [Pseudomonas aegrilactucae]|uniref:ABATE domain-containing protein n=1 Tax=Pseudomonas aegrilactucae TaxID=2854028 RepID=A0A9Q2XKP1_9PSED|nr:ABATE domain-containing protein [Pseudomonas aegrilactucae]MBV6287861.1 ABATE domain-containing protein [Pseudomonas aegrilactucae]